MAESICTVAGCERPYQSRGCCNMHYIRARRRGLPLPPRIVLLAQPCKIEGCSKYGQSRQMCQKHYTRWLRHGDPLAVFGGPDATGEANHGWAGESTTYRAVHKRLTRTRGPASDYACVVCGLTAAQWSYDYHCPSEHVSPEGHPYTADLSFYSPRCMSCHKLMDAPRKSGCPKGHPFSGDNLIVRKDGTRACRACKKISDHKCYAARALPDTPTVAESAC
jgi:hypothetical protein